MQRDTLVFDLIKKELERQRHGIELIASENFTSLQVMQAMGNVMTNKYAEGYPGRRYYAGCEIVDQTEQLAIDRLKEIFGVEYANVQPHSGAQANAAVALAVLQPGDALYLPTAWFHYIVSLNMNYQCNAQSGSTTENAHHLRECGFIIHE